MSGSSLLTSSSLGGRQVQGDPSSPSLQPRDCNHTTLLTEEKVPVSLEIHTKSSFFCLELLTTEMHHVLADKPLVTNLCVCVCVYVNHSVMSDSL